MTKIKRLIAMSCLFSSILPIGVACAADDYNARFNSFDANGDRKLSQQEFVDGKFGLIRFIKAPTDKEVADMKAAFAVLFKASDLNHNGFLSVGEFVAGEARSEH